MGKIGHLLRKHIWKSITDIFETIWDILKIGYPWTIIVYAVIGYYLLYFIVPFIDPPTPYPDDSIFYNIKMTQMNQTENNDYVLLVSWSDPLKECPIEDARFTLYGSNRTDMSHRQHAVSEVLGKSIDNETFIVFRDNDSNGNISRGDVFIIKSAAHIDDDGNSSSGYAREGYVFEVRGGKVQMAEILLK